MKLIFIISGALLFAAYGEQKISGALEKGDAHALSTYLSSTVEISINEDMDFYTKPTATEKLSSFFDTHKPQSFRVIHSCHSKGNSSYTIGNLSTSGGTYRISIYFQETGNRLLIREIHMEQK